MNKKNRNKIKLKDLNSSNAILFVIVSIIIVYFFLVTIQKIVVLDLLYPIDNAVQAAAPGILGIGLSKDDEKAEASGLDKVINEFKFGEEYEAFRLYELYCLKRFTIALVQKVQMSDSIIYPFYTPYVKIEELSTKEIIELIDEIRKENRLLIIEIIEWLQRGY